MVKGRIRSYFPGGNTPNGYISFFDRCIDWQDANRIIIIKGGPGVGKSTIMKRIGKELLKDGLDIEYLHCSSDSTSLDGLVVPELKVAILDGTPPHQMDPKFPGIVDEILNLGEFWNTEGLVQKKTEIQALQARNKRCYKRAYNYMKMAQIAHEDLKEIYEKALDISIISKKTNEILDYLFAGIKRSDRKPNIKHMFASGITPEGLVNFLDSLFSGLDKRYILTGHPGTGKSSFLKKVALEAESRGLNLEVFHCPMNIEKIDHIIIKDLNIGFITSVKPHILGNLKDTDEILDFDEGLIKSKLKGYEETINYDNFIKWDLLQKAVKSLEETKMVHDDLEKCYIENMNFSVVNEKREQIVQRITKYINNKS